MGVRLNKVLSELNIGLQTAVDFLKAHQELGEIRDDANPNTKIWDSQYEALVKEFGQVPKLNVVGKIDLDSLNQSTRPKPGVRLNKVLTELNIGLQTAVDFLKHHKELGYIKDDANVNYKISIEQYNALVNEFKDDGNFKNQSGQLFPKKKPSQEVHVLGKIDLDSLNQSKRPQKKNLGSRMKGREGQTEQRVNVVGKIDLASLNQRIRPKEESKDVHIREQEEKVKPEFKPIGKINLDELNKKNETIESKKETVSGTSSHESKESINDSRYDIFVSYSRKDSTRVQTIVNELQNNGYKIWIDKEGIESGDAFKAVIVKAIKKAEVFLFFSSIDANKSPWTVKEVNVAVYLKKVIIPVKLDNSEYDDSVLLDLAGLDFIDLTNEAKHDFAVSKLDKALKKKIRNIASQTK